MKDVPITCPVCEGEEGNLNIDGVWVACEMCDGKGWVTEDQLEEQEKDDDE